MKLLEARIDGFGQLTGLHCRLDSSAVILYGLNEAGKSTLFSFIKAMLYGFAKRNNLVERQEPVNGGAHGGQLLFESAAGERYLIERYADRGGGKLKLRRLGVEGIEGEESWLSQEEWERQFLGGTNERLFRQLYAVTLTELQEAGALSGDELGRYLYHAGWEGGKAIAAAEKRLAQEMESLFKPRGANQQMNRQLKALEHTEAALRKQADGITAYNQLKRQLELIDQELELLEEELPNKQGHLQLLDKANAVRLDWLRRLELQQEREGIAEAGRITAEAEHRWLELHRERAQLNEQLEALYLSCQLLTLQHDAIVIDEQLLETAEEVEAVLQESERIQHLQQERVELIRELRADDEVIGRYLSRISGDWTEEQLRSLRITVADREYVRGVKALEAEAGRLEERLNAELYTSAEQEREAAQAIAETDAEQARLDAAQGSGGVEFVPRTREALRAAWNACDAALREWELERLRGAAAPEAGRSGAGPLWAGAAAAGGAALALGAAALAGGGDAGTASAAGAAALGAAALALAGLALLRSRQQRRKPRQRGRGRALGALQAREQRGAAALAALVREPAQAAAALQAQGGAASAAAAQEHAQAVAQVREQLRAAVDARLEALHASERISAARIELARRHARLRAAALERREAAAAAAQERAAAARQWRGWLEALALPPGMSPDAALEVFELAEQALLRLEQRERHAAKKAAAEARIAAFEAQAASLCAAYPEAAHKQAADPALALRLLQAEQRRQAAAQVQAASIAERLKEQHLSIQTAEARLMQSKESAATLVQQADMPSEAAFAAGLQHRSRLAAIDAELSKLTIELTAGMNGQRLTELEQLLAGYDEAELQSMRLLAIEAAEKAQSERTDKLDARGRLRQQLEHLLQEDEQRLLLADKEMIIAQLERDAERYAVLSVSSGLIRATRRIYEEERQPVVLRLASGFVQQLTEGRYKRVLTAPGNSSIRLETAELRIVDSVMLSRGTAEQVYLAMRLALAVESAQAAQLPLLLDDLFVNFDKARLQAAAKLLVPLCQQRQLILFTCHEHIRDMLMDKLPEALLYELSPAK